MGKRGSNDERVEEMALWELNDVQISNHYERGEKDGQVYYSRKPGKEGLRLPASFWERELKYERQAREVAERQVLSSGNAALSIRRRNQDGRLLSQEIANNPNIGLVTSSAENAQRKRGKDKGKKEDEGAVSKKE